MRFEWDPSKNAANVRRHGLGFDEACRLFESGVDYLEIFDDAHSSEEDRFLAIGPVARGVVVVVYTEVHDDVLRIISARRATRRERELYRQHLRPREDTP